MPNKIISKKLNVRVYKTAIRPLVLSGCETWTLGTEKQQGLEVWERKVLRNMYGGKQVDRNWERRNSPEIYELFSEPNIVGEVV